MPRARRTPMRLSHSLIGNSSHERKGARLTDYSTGQAVIFVLTEDIGQLLGLVEIVEFGARFGRGIRHVVVDDEKRNGWVLVSSRHPIPSWSHCCM